MIVKQLDQADIPQMEAKINRFLAEPANAGAWLASAFQGDNGDVVLIFQKP